MIRRVSIEEGVIASNARPDDRVRLTQVLTTIRVPSQVAVALDQIVNRTSHVMAARGYVPHDVRVDNDADLAECRRAIALLDVAVQTTTFMLNGILDQLAALPDRPAPPPPPPPAAAETDAEPADQPETGYGEPVEPLLTAVEVPQRRRGR